VRALVTGGRSGIGAAIVEAVGPGAEILDLADGHDVSDGATWSALDGPFEAAFLNAGIVTGESDVATLSDAAYRRILAVNVDGVIFGVRELAARLMPGGGAIVVTASLAGLTDMRSDPVYALTKHALVGFVRSVAPQLSARGIRINAVCPGPVDTPLVPEEVRDRIPWPLIRPALVAEAALETISSGESGQCWVVQANRIERWRYPGVPGPR
jgi:NAD(P)-dependent dehydrogenase (short-subunit alcohol dehydrogenase family)